MEELCLETADETLPRRAVVVVVVMLLLACGTLAPAAQAVAWMSSQPSPSAGLLPFSSKAVLPQCQGPLSCPPRPFCLILGPPCMALSAPEPPS